jgi:hypothetical protein
VLSELNMAAEASTTATVSKIRICLIRRLRYLDARCDPRADRLVPHAMSRGNRRRSHSFLKM